MSLRQRILHLLIAVDQLVYVLISLGGGYPDETMSAAAWRVERQGRIFGRIFRPLIDALFFALTLGTEREHCRAAYWSELRRLQLPLSLRRSDPS